MHNQEFEKHVLMELKRLSDKLDRLTDLVEQNQSYLEEMAAQEEPHLNTRWAGGFAVGNKNGLS